MSPVLALARRSWPSTALQFALGYQVEKMNTAETRDIRKRNVARNRNMAIPPTVFSKEFRLLFATHSPVISIGMPTMNIKAIAC